VVGARLEEVDVDEQELVVEALDFGEEGGDEGEGGRVLAALEAEGGEAEVDALAEEGALLGFCPCGLLLADFDLFGDWVGWGVGGWGGA
jgi:hypothetical protein